MNRTELIFLGIVTVILLICISKMPQYSFVFIFLLVLAIIYLLMNFLANTRTKYENRKLSILFCIVGIILFTAYFVNAIFMDFANKGSASNGLLILALFIITMFLGWFFEENKN